MVVQYVLMIISSDTSATEFSYDTKVGGFTVRTSNESLLPTKYSILTTHQSPHRVQPDPDITERQTPSGRAVLQRL
jgi:hypothetical protein